MHKLLLVDDVTTNLDILVDTFSDTYDIRVATNGRLALDAAAEEAPDLILLDVMMPEMNGFEVLAELKKMPHLSQVPVIFITAKDSVDDKTAGFTYGAVDYITKPFEIAEVKARVATHLSLKETQTLLQFQNDHLEQLVAERTRKIALVQSAAIYCMSVLAEHRDPETGGHIQRTQTYVRLLGEKVLKSPHFTGQLTDHKLDLIVQATPMHDIGKVGVPDHILLKPGKLTVEEFEIMKTHSSIGANALGQAREMAENEPVLQYAEDLAGNHHEKWDGSGYPTGLQGDKIPLAGRLMAIADVYDALIAKRVYKEPFTHEKAVGIILEGRGVHFDPHLVDLFEEVQEEFRLTALKLADFDEERTALRGE